MENALEQQKSIVAEHVRLENSHDWDGVNGTFVQDERAFYDVVPLGTRFKGIEGVRNFYQVIAHALPDLHIEIATEYHVPGCSILEVVITGTHSGEYLGMKPLGNKVRVELASFYTFDLPSGKLVSERIYFDQAGVLEQMQGKQSAAVT